MSLVSDFNIEKDVLVVPFDTDFSKLGFDVRKIVTDLEEKGRVIRVQHCYSAAVIKSPSSGYMSGKIF